MTHWTQNDFIDWKYGLKCDGSHLEECGDCRQRAGAVSARAVELIREPDVSWEFLAAQRRSIYRRLGSPVGNFAVTRWAVSLATVVMAVVLSFSLLRPAPTAGPLVTPQDAKLYSDLVSIDESNEPRAISPIHSLFEE